jgi:hypothetical protein
MRELLIKTMGPVLWIVVIGEAVAIYRMFRQYSSDRTNRIPLLVGIMCIGLFYDALILALGVFLKEGAALKWLSQFRYIFHLTMIPLLFPVIALALGCREKLQRTIDAATAVVILIGLVAGIKVATEARTVGAVTRYAESELTPGWVDTIIQFLDIFPVFLMIGAGVYLIIKKKDWNMFFAGAFMLLFTMLGIFLGKDPGGDKTQSLMFYISMFGEALMVFFLWRFSEKKRDEAAD